jgi:hypothetical protein
VSSHLFQFQAVVTIRDTVAHFKRSTRAIHQLRKAQETFNLSTGIVSIGKTRFGTLFFSGNSIVKNFDAIVAYARAIPPTDRQSRLGVDLLKWSEDETSVLELRLIISRFVGLLEPLARSITCLESPHSSAADVMLFWLAAATGLDEYLRKTTLASSLKGKIRKLVNARFAEMVHAGPSDSYLAALFFHWGEFDLNIHYEDIDSRFIDRVQGLSPCSVDAH